MSDSSNSPIIVTGASGWVGRTILDQLSKKLSRNEFRSRLRAFSNQATLIQSRQGYEIQTHPLNELEKLADQEKYSLFLHAAFLTPDYYNRIGREAYCDINKKITESVVSAIQKNGDARVVVFSSGAAGIVDSNQTMNSKAKKVYGELKLKEEKLLAAAASTLVLRIFGLTGRNMRDPRRYAIGDFIRQAIAGGPIRVISPNEIVRGYVHADTLVKVAIEWLLSNQIAPSNPIDAVTHEISLLQLANKVAKSFRLIEVSAEEYTNKMQDIYSGDPTDFLSLMDYFKIELPSIELQIQDTAKGISQHVS